MPIWSEILNELNQRNPPDFDGVRRKYLLALHRHTGRNVILYASGWLQKKEQQTVAFSINDEDIQGLMEVTHGLAGDELDLILHSPGGSPETAEAMVSYLRSRFSRIRVIVPQLAKSAATMIACAADEIALGRHSFLGPTDPQLLLPTPLGSRMAPAQAILDQFDRAKQESVDPQSLSAWMPMLTQYGPDLLIQCESVLNMSRDTVKLWLETWMFANEPNRSEKAKQVSEWLADRKTFKSHGRHISRDEIERQGLAIVRLEDDQALQDLALSIFHATTHTFNATPAVKIIENHAGRALINRIVKQPNKPVPPAS